VRSDARIARVIDVIVRDLSRRISRAEAARLANLEPAYFSKRFRKVTGLSFAVWSARTRIQAAQQLLGVTEFKVALIAAYVGYNDVTTLDRNFRKQTGICPRQYRALLLASKDTKRQQDDTKRRDAITLASVDSASR
jgi:transcriptional regulator GlxA family with amidase domain